MKATTAQKTFIKKSLTTQQAANPGSNLMTQPNSLTGYNSAADQIKSLQMQSFVMAQSQHAAAVAALPELQKINFVSPDLLRPPEGVSTGVAELDKFLLWQGLPKGELTLLEGRPGTGATSLCIQAVREAHKKNQWVAWVQGETQLLPTHLVSRQVNLKKLLVVQKPEENDKFFWILQELITSSLFEVVACEVKDILLKTHQIMKLKKLARLYKVALVLVSSEPLKKLHSLFSLVIRFQRDFVTILRALHRPTPFHFAGSTIYENFMPQFKKASRQLAV